MNPGMMFLKTAVLSAWCTANSTTMSDDTKGDRAVCSQRAGVAAGRAKQPCLEKICTQSAMLQVSFLLLPTLSSLRLVGSYVHHLVGLFGMSVAIIFGNSCP